LYSYNNGLLYEYNTPGSPAGLAGQREKRT
jgi:hypothetical protein